MSIGLSSFMRLCKAIGVIGGGITVAGLIGLIVWVLFAQSNVESCIDKKWGGKNGHREEVIKIADSVTQSYTNDLYEKQTQTYFSQRAMMTEAQKISADKEYRDYKRNCLKRNNH